MRQVTKQRIILIPMASMRLLALVAVSPAGAVWRLDDAQTQTAIHGEAEGIPFVSWFNYSEVEEGVKSASDVAVGLISGIRHDNESTQTMAAMRTGTEMGVWQRMKESAMETYNGWSSGNIKVPAETVETAKRAISEMKEFAQSEFQGAKDRLMKDEGKPRAIKSELCSSARDLGLSKATTLYSNLGGLGPNLTSPQSVRFANVFPDGGMNVDMLVTATSKYVGTPIGKNALHEDFMVINVNSGSSVTLSVSFLDRISGSPVPVEVPAFLFTIAGLSHQAQGGGEMSVQLEGFTDIYTSREHTSDVNIRGNHHWNATFTSSTPEIVPATPKDRLLKSINMLPEHLSQAVTVRMPRVAKFEMKLSVSAGYGSRDFLFTGASNVVCPAKASCSSFSCPAFFERRKRPESILCRGQECLEEDTTTCCEPITPEHCHPARTLAVSSSNLKHSNLGGLGPDFDQPKSIVFTKVFPYSDDRQLDLEITAASTYSPANESMNSLVDAPFGTVNVAPGTSVDLLLSFYEHGTRSPATPGHMFYLSFGAFDKKAGMGIDQVRVFSSYIKEQSVESDIPIKTTVDFLNRTVFEKKDDSQPTGTPEISLLMAHRASYGLTISAPAGPVGQTFRFSGYSTKGCPPLASLCERTTCPGGHQKRLDALSRRCAHDVCNLEDTGICCEPSMEEVCDSRNVIKFMPDSLLENNLGGSGPHTDAPAHVLISDILPESDQRVNLRITSLDKYWIKHIPHNGLEDFLKFEIEAGSASRLKLEFISQETGKPVTLPLFYLTVADVDKGHGHFAVESVGLAGDDYVNVTSSSTLRRSTSMAFGRTWNTFVASEFGDERESDQMRANSFETKNSLGAMYHQVSEITVLLKVSEARASNASSLHPRAFYIAGQTSMACPVPRASCASFVCPAKQVLRRNAQSLSCAGSTCMEGDEKTCCHPSNEEECSHTRSMILAQHSLSHSNLCGLGPDKGEATMIFGDVFPGSNKQIDLEISSTGECGVFDPTRNGMDGSIGSISIKSGATMKLDFRLVDAKTRQPVKGMWPYIVTFLNMDVADDDDEAGYIEVAVSNLVSYQVTDRTTLRVKNNTFRSSGKPGSDRPSHPHALMPRHLAKSVALKFEKPEFNVLASVSAGSKSGHSLMFAGSSNLACPTLAFCNTLSCPAGFEHAQTANSTTCLGAVCTQLDINTCCVRKQCSPERLLQIRPDHVRHSNLGGYGPSDSADKTIVFADVFPSSGQEVDLAVSAIGPYYQQNASLNGADGPFGRINMAPGTDVTLRFKFVEPGTSTLANVESFFFSIFNIAEPSDDLKKMVNVSSYEWYAVTKRSKLSTEMHNSKDFFISAPDMEDWRLRVSPSHPLALGPTQLNHSVTFMMPGNPEFTLSASLAAGWFGQNILFAGPSSIICRSQALCSTHNCPVGTLMREGAGRLVCSGPRCNHLDTPTCCVEKANSKARKGLPRPSEWAVDEDVVVESSSNVFAD